MTAKKTAEPAIETVNGTVTIDPAASYRLTLAKAVKVAAGHVLKPSARNVEVTGEALLAIAGQAVDGAILDATLIAVPAEEG